MTRQGKLIFVDLAGKNWFWFSNLSEFLF
jgi:hypothetical protein